MEYKLAKTLALKSLQAMSLQLPERTALAKARSQNVSTVFILLLSLGFLGLEVGRGALGGAELLFHVAEHCHAAGVDG